MPSIARSSTISSVNSITIGADLTATLGFTITRYANSFYHKLSYTLDGATYQIWSTPVQTTSGSIAYSTLINQVKTGASKALVFTLTTYSSSAGTTQIGTAQTKTVTVNINTSVYKPSVSLTGITIDTSPINTKLIGGYSIANIAYSGTNPTGSTKTTVYFTASNASLATATVEKTTSTFSGNVLTTTLPASKGDYTFTVYAYAKDSRGVSSATVQLSSATVYKYTPPVITASAFRVEDDVSTTQDDAGTYVYVTYSATVGSSIDGTNSIQSVTCTYTGGTAQSGDHIPLSESSSLVLTFTATDLVGSNTVEITVNPATYPLDLYDDGTAQHQGVGLCAIAEPDKVKAGKDIYAPSVYAGSTSDNTERRVKVSSGAGELYMYSQASSTGSRGLYAPAPTQGTGTNKAIISVNVNNNATFNGNATSATNATNATDATYATRLKPYPQYNPTSTEDHNYHDGTMFHYMATGDMTTGKPASNGHIIEMQWHSTSGTKGTLLFLRFNNDNHNVLGVRGSSGTAWSDWSYADTRRQLWTGTTAGQGSKSISLDMTGYSYLKIWAHCYDVCFSFDVDLTTAPQRTIAGGTNNTAYRGSGVAPLYTTGASSVRMEQYFCLVEVNSDKTTLTVVQIGYFRGSGTYEARLSNAAYYIYKIEGYL